MGDHVPVRMPLGQLFAREPSQQVPNLRGKAIGRRVRVRVQGVGRAHIGAGRAAQAEIDPAGGDGLQHPKLLGHLEGGVVGQHHPGAADADPLRRGRDGGD